MNTDLVQQLWLMDVERDWRLDAELAKKQMRDRVRVADVFFCDVGSDIVLASVGVWNTRAISRAGAWRAVASVFGDARAVAERVRGNVVGYLNGLSFQDKVRVFNAL